MLTVELNFLVPALLIGTIDFCYFISLSLTLTVPGGHKVSAKRNLLASFSPMFPSDHDKILCGDEAIQAEHHETTFE